MEQDIPSLGAQKEPQPLQVAPLFYNNGEKVTQSYAVVQTPDDADDFYVRLRATNLRRIRYQLGQLSSGNFPWAELLLAVSTTSIGGTLGAIAGDVKLDGNSISIICYNVLPAIFLGTIIGWAFLRHRLIVNARTISESILAELPKDEVLKKSENLDSIPSIETPELAASEATQGSSEELDRSFTPDDSWTLRIYELAYSLTVADEKSLKIDAAFKASKLNENEQNAIRWEGWKLYSRINFFHKSEEFLELRELADRHTKNKHLNEYVARIYKRFEDHIQAALYFEKAASSSAPGSIDYIQNMGNAAVERWAGGDKELANIHSKEIRTFNASSTELLLAKLEAERAFLEESNDKERLAAILEKILEIDPLNHENRFSLAFTYGELGRHRLAVLHYQRIPSVERQPNAWNNLGVSLSELDIKGLAIQAFEKSAELKSSLARSNLANKYITAGFVAEAKKLLDTEFPEADRHENIDHSLVAIREAQANDQVALKKVKSKAEELSAFTKRFGESICNKLPQDIDGDFEAIGMSLSIRLENGALKGDGKYITSPNRLAGLLFASDNKIYENFTIFASLRGASATGYLNKIKSSEPTTAAKTLLTDSGAYNPINIFVSPDGGRIDMLEIQSEEKAKIYTFLKIKPTEKIALVTA